jgi:hypothetical protein
MNYRLGMSFYENHKTGHLEEPADIARRNADLEAASVFEQVVRSTGTAVIVQNMRFDFLVASTGSDKLHQRWKEREREGSYRYDKPLAFFHYIPDVAKWNVIRFMKQHL